MIPKYATGSIADFLERRICYRRDDYAVQLASEKYARMGKPLMHDDITAHIRGEITIGVYQSKYPEEYWKWVVYGIDHDEDNPAKSGIQKVLLESILIRNDVPFYVEDSGSPNSVHLWVFLSKPTPLHIAYNWARAMIVRGGKYVFNSEIFPKQAALNPEKPFGNLVKVPFGIHQKSGRWTSFRDGEEMILEGVETVSLTHWKPVDIPRNERGERKTIDWNIKDTKGSDTKINSSDNVGLYRYSTKVRPCIQQMIDSGMQFRHEDGHKLRIAIASELLACGTTFEEVIKAFEKQEDFDYWVTKDKVWSVRGYNRPTCHRIQWHCRNLQSESGFNIDSMCQDCIFCPETIIKSLIGYQTD